VVAPLSRAPVEPARRRAEQLAAVVAVICFVWLTTVKLQIDSTGSRRRGISMAAIFGTRSRRVVFAERDVAYLSLPGADIVICTCARKRASTTASSTGGWRQTPAALVSVVSSCSTAASPRSYAMVAIAGTYLTPLLIPVLRGDRFELMLYYVIWDAVYAFLSVLLRSRFVLLMAAYLSIATFA
jgi:hypothetical protein